MYIKDEQGFTILEMILVIGLLVILLSVLVINLNSVNDTTIVAKIKSEVNNMYDIAVGYQKSTSNYRESEMVEQINKALDGYSSDPSAKRSYTITETTDSSGKRKLTMQVKAVVDENLLLKADIEFATGKIRWRAEGDPDRVETLVNKGEVEG